MAKERSWGVLEVVLVFLIIVGVTGLVLARQSIIASDNDEWATAIEAYFTEARRVADDFVAADETILGFLDATVAGEELTSAEVDEAKAAVDSMDRLRAEWGRIPPPEELVTVHEDVGEAMRLVQEGDVAWYEAYTAGYPRGIAAANTVRRNAIEILEGARADLEAWYDENEAHIERALR